MFKNKNLYFGNGSALDRELKYLPKILQSKSIYTNPLKAIFAKYLLRWGMKPTINGRLTEFLSKLLGKKLIYIEDGFIRSHGIGISKEPTLSIIYDEIAPYYNAEVETSLQAKLNDSKGLSDDNLKLSKRLIKDITDNKISKYNFYDNSGLKIKDIDPKKTILIVDQRYGDYSVKKGLADESSFKQMFETALSEFPKHKIIVKKHPDSFHEDYSSFISDYVISRYSNKLDIEVITQNINPYELLQNVSKVFTVTSLMGFEALMAGKEVYCFGMPFYAGRGVTNDVLKKPSHRKKDSSIEEIFYYSYVDYSRFYNPKNPEEIGSIDLVIDEILLQKANIHN